VKSGRVAARSAREMRPLDSKRGVPPQVGDLSTAGLSLLRNKVWMPRDRGLEWTEEYQSPELVTGANEARTWWLRRVRRSWSEVWSCLEQGKWRASELSEDKARAEDGCSWNHMALRGAQKIHVFRES
jgi:hypothetical protein